MPTIVLNQSHARREPVDDALFGVRLVQSRLCQSMFRAPWAVRVPAAEQAAVFVAVADGSCLLTVGARRRVLQAGDFVLLPHGDAHCVADQEGTPVGGLAWDRVRGRCVINAGGDGALTHLVTGSLAFEASPLMQALPAFLHVPRNEELGWQQGISGVLCREAMRPGPGSEVVLTQLAVLLAIGAIRRWLTQDETAECFLRAIRTPNIRKVLDAMHVDPTEVWTLERLAHLAGMSRSAFSQRFQETVGVSPMRYWTRWRMSVARDWLAEGQQTVDEVADALGYQSRAAFARAYKANTGEPPGRTRRAGRPALRTLNDQIMAP